MKQMYVVLLFAFGVQSVCAIRIARAADPAPTAPAAVASGASFDDTVVARVGDRIVTMSELNGPLVDAYGLNVLLNLVQLELAQKQAEETKVSVTDADVAAERDFTLKKMFADAEKADYDKLFEQFLTQQRITRPEFDIVMRINANLRKVAEPMLAGKITDDGLQEAFRALYGEKVKVRHIQAANLQEIQEARARLEKEPFEKVARELSRNARTKAAGGDLPEFSRAMVGLPEAFKDAAFALKEGAVSDPIMADGAYHLIKLEKRIAPTAVKFEDVKESIRADLHERAIQATIRELRNQIGAAALKEMKIEIPELQRQFEARREQSKQEGSLTEESDIRKQFERERKRATQPASQPTDPADPSFKLPDPAAAPAAPGGAQ